MRVEISQSESLEFISMFPFQRDDTSKKKNKVLLGIGANVGDVKKNFATLFRKLEKNKKFAIITSSPLYKNPPFGFLKQDSFYNAVLFLKTDLGYLDFFRHMSYLERVFGRARKRAIKDGPRVMDIDVLLFSDMTLNTPTLRVPHKGFFERKSVLVPLSFIRDSL